MATLLPVLVIGTDVIGLRTAVTLTEAGYPVAVRNEAVSSLFVGVEATAKRRSVM